MTTYSATMKRIVLTGNRCVAACRTTTPHPRLQNPLLYPTAAPAAVPHRLPGRHVCDEDLSTPGFKPVVSNGGAGLLHQLRQECQTMVRSQPRSQHPVGVDVAAKIGALVPS